MPRVYLKRSCPHCLRLRIFLTEAGLAGDYEFVAFAQDDDTHRATRRKMEDAGTKPSFPAIEHPDGRWETDSEAVIARLAAEHRLDPDSLPLYRFYVTGLYERHQHVVRENKRLVAEASGRTG